MDNFKILLQSAISRKSSQSTYCQKITVLFAVSAVLHSFEWGGSPIYIGIFSSIFVSCVQTDNKIAESIRIWTVGRLSSDYIYFIRLFRYFQFAKYKSIFFKNRERWIESFEYRNAIIFSINRQIETENAIIFFSFFITWLGKSICKIAFYIQSTFDRTIQFIDQLRFLYYSIKNLFRSSVIDQFYNLRYFLFQSALSCKLN